jgi:ferredoxin-NADP reductase
MPGDDIAVVYRAAGPDEVLFRAELDELARPRGAARPYVFGDRGGDGALSPERLRALVPDIAERDVFVCGPPSLTAAARVGLRAAGVPPGRIVSEGFGA